MANSRVGVIINTYVALIFSGLCNNLSNNGSANAAVFPDPF